TFLTAHFSPARRRGPLFILISAHGLVPFSSGMWTADAPHRLFRAEGVPGWQRLGRCQAVDSIAGTHRDRFSLGRFPATLASPLTPIPFSRPPQSLFSS